MPRSRKRRPDPAREERFDRMIAGFRRTEVRGGREWSVQPVSAQQATKAYTCPGCSRDVPPGTSHVVAWRADSILGDAAALADRRHWHSTCWGMT